MYNILLIGAGQLGSRHLQGLAKIDIPVCLGIVEPNPENLERARSRYKEIPENQNIKSIYFWNNISDINFNSIDLAIIATNADIRHVVTEQLIKSKETRNLLFEKVLFQSPSIIDQQSSLLEQHNINAWINCPRRMYPVYQSIKEKIKNEQKIRLSIQGGSWGLACNSIHFIDLFSFLTDSYNISEAKTQLDDRIIQSKRPGFIELTGQLQFVTNNKDCTLFIESLADSELPLVINLTSENFRFIILEYEKTIITFSKENNWKEMRQEITIPFQSELTSIIAKDILTKNDVKVTSFKESAFLHKTMLSSFINHLNHLEQHKYNYCPIT